MKVTRCNLCWNSNIDGKLLGDHIQRRGGELGKCAGVARVISNRNAYRPCSPLLSISQHVEVPESLSLFLHCFKEEESTGDKKSATWPAPYFTPVYYLWCTFWSSLTFSQERPLILASYPSGSVSYCFCCISLHMTDLDLLRHWGSSSACVHPGMFKTFDLLQRQFISSKKKYHQ